MVLYLPTFVIVDNSPYRLWWNVMLSSYLVLYVVGLVGLIGKKTMDLESTGNSVLSWFTRSGIIYSSDSAANQTVPLIEVSFRWGR